MWFVQNAQVKCGYRRRVHYKVEVRNRRCIRIICICIKQLKTEYCYCFSFEVLDNLLWCLNDWYCYIVWNVYGNKIHQVLFSIIVLSNDIIRSLKISYIRINGHKLLSRFYKNVSTKRLIKSWCIYLVILCDFSRLWL